MLPSFTPERKVADPANRSFVPIDLSIEQQLTNLESVFDSAPVGLCVLDLQFQYMTVNACFARMYRLPVEDFPGRSVEQVLPGPAPQIIAHLKRVLETNKVFEAEITLMLPVRGSVTGEMEELIYLRSAQPILNPSGQVVGLSVALLDITSRKCAEAALRESEENLRFTVQLTPHIPWTADASGELTFMSSRWNEMTGRNSEQVILLKDWVLAVNPDDRVATGKAWQNSVDTGDPYDREYRVRCGDGSWRWMRARAYPRRDSSGAILRWYGTVEDINEKKMIEAVLQAKTDELARSAQEDHLTGLANRRRFDDILGREIERAKRSRSPLGLILIDIDHFKRYNDIWGHIAGDECLKAVAGAIRGVIRRPGDLAARFGGEEFGIILPNTSKEGALEIAKAALGTVRLITLSSTAPDGGGVTISAGLVMFDPQGNIPFGPDPVALIEAADSALYQSKAKGRDCVTSASDLIFKSST